MNNNIKWLKNRRVFDDEPVSIKLVYILYKGDILDFMVFFKDPKIPDANLYV